MRFTRWAILAALPAALATLGCDSTQPDQVSASPATLLITAEAKVDNNNCWEVWEDTNDDSVPDQNDNFVICSPVGSETKVTRSVPWRYSIQVSLLRSGETTAEILGTSAQPGGPIPLYASMTPYDQTPPAVGATRPPEPPYYFLNPVTASNGSEYWLTNNGYNLGEPNVLEEVPTYNFNLNPGDTVIVEARKQPVNEGPAYLPTDEDAELHILGKLTLGGVEVQLQGQSLSTNEDKSGISFSYTRR
jgi:hypothetical protein